MTNQLYAIHNRKGEMVSDPFSTESAAWRDAWSKVSEELRPHDLWVIKAKELGYTCDPVVVSNPKTSVVVDVETKARVKKLLLYLIECRKAELRIDHIDGCCDDSAYKILTQTLCIEVDAIKQFLEAGNA